MRIGLERRDVAVLAIGALLGWAASRQVIPTPQLVQVSPVVSCAGADALEATVPLAENAQWAVQSAGGRWWDPRAGRWTATAPWHAGPGKVIAPARAEGVRLVVRGLSSAQIAGATIKGLQKVEKEK